MIQPGQPFVGGSIVRLAPFDRLLLVALTLALLALATSQIWMPRNAAAGRAQDVNIVSISSIPVPAGRLPVQIKQ